MEKLDRNLALKTAVTTLSEPDPAHSTLAEGRDEFVSPEGLARKRWFVRMQRLILQKPLLGQRLMLL
jgi:hypothetical protein